MVRNCAFDNILRSRLVVKPASLSPAVDDGPQESLENVKLIIRTNKSLTVSFKSSFLFIVMIRRFKSLLRLICHRLMWLSSNLNENKSIVYRRFIYIARAYVLDSFRSPWLQIRHCERRSIYLRFNYFESIFAERNKLQDINRGAIPFRTAAKLLQIHRKISSRIRIN